MSSEKIVNVLWSACGCDAPLACIFAKTGENYSPRTQVFSPRTRVFSSRLSPRISPTGVFSPKGFVHRRKLTLIESRPWIQRRKTRFDNPILGRESAYRWHTCVSLEPAALKLIPAVLQTLNRDCDANPWCVLTRKKNVLRQTRCGTRLRGLYQNRISFSQPLPSVSQVTPPLFYYPSRRWTLGAGAKIILTRVWDRSPKLERGIRPLPLLTLGRRQEYESNGRHLDAAIRLPPVGFAA
jgi:hypothetical protein